MNLAGGRFAQKLNKNRETTSALMPTSNQQTAVIDKAFPLTLTIGELIACTEASTKFYIHATKEYIMMKKDRDTLDASMREKLWLISHTKAGLEKFQCIIESLSIAVLVEYREFERDNPPPLAE